MRTITVGEFNTSFPEILKVISLGEKVGILQDDHKIPVALIVPYSMYAEKELKKKEIEKTPLFAETYGMWEGRDIDIKEIRKERREKRTKYYENATL